MPMSPVSVLGCKFKCKKLNNIFILNSHVNALIAPSKHGIELRLNVTAGLDALVSGLYLGWLVEGDAETLGSHAGGPGLQTLVPLTELLDLVLALLHPAEWSLQHALLLQV